MKSVQGISVSLPLVYGTQDGPYILNKEIGQVVKQNFKNLLLTNPGERVMIPDFGAGVRRLLFEPATAETYSALRQRISTQISKFMPFVEIEELLLLNPEQDESLSPNAVRLVIRYNVGSINDSDTLIITQNQN